MNALYYLVGTPTPVIDADLVDELLDICKDVMGLFSTFPLNVFLVAGLASIGFGFFRKAKRAIRG